MNITHAIEENVSGDMLEAIFRRQNELMIKYHDIELRSGLMQTEDCPVNLDDKRGQARIKDYSWRVTEELGEALDARMQDDLPHFKEELIDGLHFLTELSILSGIGVDNILKNGVDYWEEVDYWDKREENNRTSGVLWNSIVKKAYDLDSLKGLIYLAGYLYDEFNIEERISDFIMHIGMTCNCLKNKPWKQSNMITDKEAFYKSLGATWISYTSILMVTMDAEEICDTYLRKSQVNKFRQRSNY